MSEDIWKYSLINGRFNKVELLSPKYEKGKLISLKDLRPFERKTQDGTEITPSVEHAQFLKRKIYTEFFKKPFKNLVVLTGAGSSMDVGGPSMNQLWGLAVEKYGDDFKKIVSEIGFDSEKKDIEALLSQLDGFIKFSNDKKLNIQGAQIKLSKIKEQLFDLIKTNCSILKPTGQFPHKIFLERLLQRKQTSPRIKIFTLNYDLLFEYAAIDVNAIVIDGFSFTTPRIFSGRFFDYDIVQREGSKLQEEDNFIQRVFHLHKLHGSLNWERNSNDEVTIEQNTLKPLLVYPRESKYEDSYEQPFFEMMARFQRNLRISNDTILICIGYSFNDKHINATIEEALNQNPGFRIAVIDPAFDEESASFPLRQIKSVALDSERVLMVSETFSDFANSFPEIKTYESDNLSMISLKNDSK